MGLILVLLSSVLFFSASPAHADSLSSLVNDARNIIDSLNTLAGSGGPIDGGLKAMANLTKRLLEIQSQATDDFTELLATNVNAALANLTDAAERGRQAGVDVSGIIQNGTNNLNNLSQQTLQNYTAGLSEIFTSALSSLNQGIQTLNQIAARITSNPVKLSKCLITLRPIPCVTQLITDMRSDVASIPGAVIQIVENGQSTVDSARDQFATLSQQTMSNALSNIAKIVADVNQAVDKAIESNNGGN